MKQTLVILIVLLAALILACSAAAEGENALSVQDANNLLGECLDRVLNSTDEAGYYVGTAEYGLLAPMDVNPVEYVQRLEKATLAAADIEEAPDGEFVVLNIPDFCQIDFFQGEAEKNYVRVTRFGDPEKSVLAQAQFPDDFYMTSSGLMQMWANELANANGIPLTDEEEPSVVLPESGWLRDSVLEGTDWQCDRASLEVFAEGDGYKVLITWGSSADEAREWTYAGYYDAEADVLNSVHVVCDDIAYSDSGEETRTEVLDQDCETVFLLNDEGNLEIRNAGDEQLEGMSFTRLPEDREPVAPLHVDTLPESDSPEWVGKLPAAENATQLFVVAGIGMDKTTAYVSMHRKDENGVWKQILSTPGFVGKKGLCLDADHAEGCAQTPIGVYHFNKAFGIAADPGCALPYVQVDENTYWSGDPDRQYNQMVDIRDVPELLMDDSEHIVDYDLQYQYCLNISFNEEGTPGRGSAIFLHCIGPVKPWTGGCVAVPENIMRTIMQNVQEDCVVVIDIAENLGIEF